MHNEERVRQLLSKAEPELNGELPPSTNTDSVKTVRRALNEVSRFTFSEPDFGHCQDGNMLASFGLFAALPMRSGDFWKFPILEVHVSRFACLFTIRCHSNINLFYPNDLELLSKTAEEHSLAYIPETYLNMLCGGDGYYKDVTLEHALFSYAN